MDSEVTNALINAAVTIFNVIFTAVFARRSERRRIADLDAARENDRTRQIESGLQSLLRAEIIRQHEKYMDKGFCPVYAREALTRVYESYHALGGNGTMTELYKQVMALPTDEREEHYEN